MSPAIAMFSLRKRSKTPTKLLTKFGSGNSKLLNDISLNVAVQSNTTLNLSTFLEYTKLCHNFYTIHFRALFQHKILLKDCS